MTLWNRMGVLGTLLMLPACGINGSLAGRARSEGAMTAPSQEQVLRSEAIAAVFTGWDIGDYVWARLEIDGREPIGAWAGSFPVEVFLDAHVGKRLNITLQTVRANISEAGGATEVQRISSARIGDLTAQEWWKLLSRTQRQKALAGLARVLEQRLPDKEY